MEIYRYISICMCMLFMYLSIYIYIYRKGLMVEVFEADHKGLPAVSISIYMNNLSIYG